MMNKVVNLQDIIDFAKKNGFNWVVDGSYSKDTDIFCCLPESECSEINAKDPETEKELDSLCYEYFNSWDKEYVNGFCTSIINRIIIGKYMTEHSISEILIIAVGDKMKSKHGTFTVTYMDDSGVLFDNGYCPNLKEVYLGWIHVDLMA